MIVALEEDLGSKMPKTPLFNKTIVGTIVDDWIEPVAHPDLAEMHFQIELLPEPVRIGAGDRTHRLWLNGEPATGGQWCYDFEQAKWNAKYMADSYLYSKIRKLEGRVSDLQSEVNRFRKLEDVD